MSKKVLIIGLGLIGGSYAEGLTRKGYEVGALSNNKEDIDFALQKGIISSGTDKIEKDYISQFGLVIFALYPRTLLSWIKENQDCLKENAILTDVTGIKGAIVREIQSILRPDLEFIGAHPMAGREVSGVQNANADIFKNANYIITPTENNSGTAIEVCRTIGEELEFKNISVLSPEEHDEMIGFLSQLTHCIAITLITCRNSEELSKYSGDSFRDLTRIAKINENMWTELFLLNKSELLRQMDAFSKEFDKLRDYIAKEDESKIKEMMKLSTEKRKAFDK